MNTINSDLPVYDLLMVDIETVPQYPDYVQMPEPWKNLWNDKMTKTMPENFSPEDSYQQRAGILAEFGKVICISTGYFFQTENNTLTLRLKSIAHHDEKLLLQSFVELCDKFYKHNKNFQFTGHNIREFDIPYLCRRMIINNIKLPAYLSLHGAKPWEVRMVDTLQWWKFGDYKHYTSLNLLAHVMNVPTSKTDMDGSQVQYVYYNDKDLPRIVEYCQRDVAVVANLMLRFKNMPLLNPEDIIVVT